MNDNTDLQVSRRGSRTLMLVAFGVVVVLATSAWYFLNDVQASSRSEELLADFGAVPNEKLIERSGEPLELKELKGNIWVATFIFTRCGGTCPGMSSKMKELQESLRKAGDVKLVSFTVDPDNDTPERLRSYAEGYNADKEKWLFLTGEKKQLQDLAKNAFHLTVEEGTDPKEPIIHSKRFVLIDQEGHIRGYYNSEEAEAKQKLLTDIGVLMRGDGR
jgi:cytochrome oxidase Cu insertion factor (SCO1/SenC/PrrC family)